MTFEQLRDLQTLTSCYQAGKISNAFVASRLNITPRHARRLLGKRFTLPIKRESWNKYGSDVRNFLIEEKKDQPYFNCQWLAELASDRFGQPISRSTVYRILQSANLLDCPTSKPVVRKRFEAQKSGDLVQMDTTWGYWLGKKKVCLILLLDDYSRYVLDGEFVWHDTAAANMRLLRRVVEKYGAFKLLYTDNASFFKPLRHNVSIYQNHAKSEYESEITRALREVGIIHFTHKPYQPQGKGKIERLFRFIQERLIRSWADDEIPLWLFNKKLKAWLDWYNEKHVNRTIGCKPKERFKPEDFTPLSKEKNLDDIFCLKDSRKVDKCNQFSYQGKIYQIPKDNCLVAMKVSLHINPDRSIRVWHNQEFVCELVM